MDDASVINYFKVLSIAETRKDPNYTFDQVKIPVITQHNDGRVYTSSGELFLKCFFISIAQGLNRYRAIHRIAGKDIEPIELIQISRFTDINNVVDTDNINHIESIERLVHALKITLQIHIGRYDYSKDTWYSTPDASVIFGDPKNRISVRILNKGIHFEYITTAEEMFIHTPRTTNSKKLAQYYQ